MHYTKCHSFVLSIKTDDLIMDVDNLQEKNCLILVKLIKNILFFWNENTDVNFKFKIEPLDTIFFDPICALKSKTYA